MTQAKFIRYEDCYTPACTYGSGKKAEVWAIGRIQLQICQTCAGHKAASGRRT